MAVDSEAFDERWPPMMDDPRQAPDESMDPRRLAALWRRDGEDAYGEAAVVGTLAIALRALGAAGSVPDAEARARSLWTERDRSRFAAA